MEVYLNKKPLRQLKTIKYLGIIIDSRLIFRVQLTQATEKWRKIIFVLLSSAKLNWGIGHKALKTLYTGGIQPLLLYGAPVCTKTIDKESYRKKLNGIQWLINIKIAKPYMTVSNEALCIITGVKPIEIKIKDGTEHSKIIRGSRRNNLQIDHDKPQNNVFIQPTELETKTQTTHRKNNPNKHLH